MRDTTRQQGLQCTSDKHTVILFHDIHVDDKQIDFFTV